MDQFCVGFIATILVVCLLAIVFRRREPRTTQPAPQKRYSWKEVDTPQNRARNLYRTAEMLAKCPTENAPLFRRYIEKFDEDGNRRIT